MCVEVRSEHNCRVTQHSHDHPVVDAKRRQDRRSRMREFVHRHLWDFGFEAQLGQVTVRIGVTNRWPVNTSYHSSQADVNGARIEIDRTSLQTMRFSWTKAERQPQSDQWFERSINTSTSGTITLNIMSTEYGAAPSRETQQVQLLGRNRTRA